MTSSIVQPPDLYRTLQSYHSRLSRIEQSDGSNPWINVADDSSDPLWTPDSPPWENGWSNAGAGQAPVSFKRFLNWVHIRGAFQGGTDGTVVFTLPATYAPLYAQAITGALTDGSGVWTCIIGTDGTVNYVTQSVF